ncbi:MAG TPA: D-xylose transporter XylE [Bacteroidales bacterium]|nr:D-xylose transporter XylE [Bacteroidales bacterium]HBZ67964.1 D-xylose transporter XylE [Bacteroidales bacterium]
MKESIKKNSQVLNGISTGKGNRAYIVALTLVATLGGLLFGYDTAVINGAEKSLVDFYILNILNPDFHTYALDVVTQYKWFVTISFYIIAIIITMQLFRLTGSFKRGTVAAGVILIIMIAWTLNYFSEPVAQTAAGLKAWADSVKGFVISSALVGCVIGGASAGFISKSWGRKKGLIAASILLTISAIGTWRPEFFKLPGLEDVFTFVFYRIVGGIGVGVASMISPMYIAEIAPAGIRGKLVSFNQFAIIFGMLVIYFVNYFIALNGDEQWLTNEGWRWMFLSEVIPSSIFLLLLIFVPETPRFLVMKNRETEAMSVLVKVSGKEQATAILSEIKETLHEKRVPWFSYGTAVIIIGILLSVFQQFVGINVVLYYAANIFRNMGASTDTSLLQTIIVGVINLAFTVLAIMTVDRLGRKPLMIIGALGMAFSMIALGFSFYFGSLGIVALLYMLLYVASFAMSWGPVTWVLLSEIFPNSIRGAMSVAVAAQWIANLIVSWTFPMMNDNTWLTGLFNHGFSYWIYGVMSFLAALFIWKFVPETKGRSLEEIESIWKKGNKNRK